MTIKNFAVQAETLNATPYKDGEKFLSLKDIISAILSGDYADEARSITGLDKFNRAKLAKKLMGDEDNFSTEELGMIKDVVGKYGTTSIVYQVFNILDGE